MNIKERETMYIETWFEILTHNLTLHCLKRNDLTMAMTPAFVICDFYWKRIKKSGTQDNLGPYKEASGEFCVVAEWVI